MHNSPPAPHAPPRKTTETALGILGSMALLYWLAMQFAHEQVEHAWTRIRGSYELQCWSVGVISDGLSRYDVKGCGRSVVYSCSPMQVVTPVHPIIYGINCGRAE